MLSIFLLILLPHISVSTICQKYEYLQKDTAAIESAPHVSPSENRIVTNYSCPGISESEIYTRCCNENKGCCLRERYFYEIDKKTATILAISVVLACFLIGAILSVCCFWERCPLYVSCKHELTPEIATYDSKDENIDMDVMPREISKRNRFSPVPTCNGNNPSRMDMEAV